MANLNENNNNNMQIKVNCFNEKQNKCVCAILMSNATQTQFISLIIEHQACLLVNQYRIFLKLLLLFLYIHSNEYVIGIVYNGCIGSVLFTIYMKLSPSILCRM
jgi:hypothetical protein